MVGEHTAIYLENTDSTSAFMEQLLKLELYLTQSVEEWYKQLPIVTRTYVTLAFITTAGCALEVSSTCIHAPALQADIQLRSRSCAV